MDWLSKAAVQDLPRAQYQIGLLYDNGEGVCKNPRMAFEWYLKAAQQGMPDAQNNVAVLYLEGAGVTADLVLAKVWFELAAARGNKLAISNSAECDARLNPAQRSEAERLRSAWKIGQAIKREL